MSKGLTNQQGQPKRRCSRNHNETGRKTLGCMNTCGVVGPKRNEAHAVAKRRSWRPLHASTKEKHDQTQKRRTTIDNKTESDDKTSCHKKPCMRRACKSQRSENQQCVKEQLANATGNDSVKHCPGEHPLTGPPLPRRLRARIE